MRQRPSRRQPSSRPRGGRSDLDAAVGDRPTRKYTLAEPSHEGSASWLLSEPHACQRSGVSPCDIRPNSFYCVECESRLEIRVAWITRPSPGVPLQIT